MNSLAVLLLTVTGSFDVRIQTTNFPAIFTTGEITIEGGVITLDIEGEYQAGTLSPYIIDIAYYGGEIVPDQFFGSKTALEAEAQYTGMNGALPIAGGLDRQPWEELRYFTLSAPEGDADDSISFAFDQSLSAHLLIAPQIHFVSVVIPAQTISLSGLNIFPISPEPTSLAMFLIGILFFRRRVTCKLS